VGQHLIQHLLLALHSSDRGCIGGHRNGWRQLAFTIRDQVPDIGGQVPDIGQIRAVREPDEIPHQPWHGSGCGAAVAVLAAVVVVRTTVVVARTTVVVARTTIVVVQTTDVTVVLQTTSVQAMD